MKWIVLIASAAFWFAMAAIWSFADWAPTMAPDAAKSATAAAEGPQYSTAQVAEHNNATSCWLIIDGEVYDLTSFIDVHPANPKTILKYCGQDGTQGFETKDRNRPHSEEARGLLKRYLIGTLSDD